MNKDSPIYRFWKFHRDFLQAETGDSFNYGAERLLYEKYKQESKAISAARALYYFAKPLVPRAMQMTLRRLYSRKQKRISFPRWPIENSLVDLNWKALSYLAGDQIHLVPFINFWPDSHDWCVLLTHDVESEAGIRNIKRVVALEQEIGFRSSWNFVAKWYPIPVNLFGWLRNKDCEVGLHGIYHDGKLFSSWRRFKSELDEINGYLMRWDVVGFRSPATHRNPEWMPLINAEYDSSFPDTDIYEPQGGGCCSIFPYFLENLVELPITLPQDHTVFEVLQQDSIQLWKEKSDFIIDNQGMILLITHPDYLIEPKRLDMYGQFLEYLKTKVGGWHTLPREAARWWKLRDGATLDAQREILLDANNQDKKGLFTVRIANTRTQKIHKLLN